MPLRSRGDAHAATQNLCQAVGGHGDAQGFGGVPFFRHDGPSPHLGERRPALLRPHYLRFHRCPETTTPLVALRQPGFANPQIFKTHIAGEVAVARTSLHFSVSIHRQQVPTVIIATLHVPAVRRELRSPHGPIVQINTAPHSLRLIQPARVSVSPNVTSRKRIGYVAACRGQQDQLVVDTITETLQNGHQLSSSANAGSFGQKPV